jgi:hypothetical protein
MGDSAEFEKLGALEARLAAAIDRIAKRHGTARGGDGGAATEDAEAARAEAAEARAAELAQRVARSRRAWPKRRTRSEPAEKTLAEAPPAADTAELDRLRADLAAREAEKAEAVAAQAALQARVAELEAAAAAEPHRRRRCGCRAGRAAAPGGARPRRTRRGHRGARQAQDLADELSEAGAATPRRPRPRAPGGTARAPATVDQLSSGLDELRSVAKGDGMDDAINRVLEAQVAALTQARKAEAAELGRILSDLMAAEAVREEEARNA